MQSKSLREELLSQRVTERTCKLYQHGFYEEAVVNSFKEIDERLRQITGQEEEPYRLLDLAFNKATGRLTDQYAWPSEREGMYLLFRGAFLTFRNRPAHVPTNMNEEEAFDQIILASRLSLIIEEAYRRIIELEEKSAFEGRYISAYELNKQVNFYEVDLDNDGEAEIVIPLLRVSTPDIEVRKATSSGSFAIDVEPLDVSCEAIVDIKSIDVDNDGINETVCVLQWAVDFGLVFYKMEQGKLRLLRKSLPEGWEHITPYFVSGLVKDLNGDGKVEVTSEDYGAVPEHLLPAGYASDELGRVRRVWQWNDALRGFALQSEELLHIGQGRY